MYNFGPYASTDVTITPPTERKRFEEARVRPRPPAYNTPFAERHEFNNNLLGTSYDDFCHACGSLKPRRNHGVPSTSNHLNNSVLMNMPEIVADHDNTNQRSNSNQHVNNNQRTDADDHGNNDESDDPNQDPPGFCSNLFSYLTMSLLLILLIMGVYFGIKRFSASLQPDK